MANVIGMAQAMAQAMAKEFAEKDREIEQLIGKRDAAEEAMSQAYYIVTGRSPEWSNRFGHAEALEDIGDAISLLKKGARNEDRSRA